VTIGDIGGKKIAADFKDNADENSHESREHAPILYTQISDHWWYSWQKK
jgi:hypothetical protein